MSTHRIATILRLPLLLLAAGLALSPASCTNDNPLLADDGGGGSGNEAGPGDDAQIASGPDMTSTCGNGTVEPGEECDNGAANNTHSSGCEPGCQFTCIFNNDQKCDDGDPCNGSEKCGMDHQCHTGSPEADGTSCGTQKICKAMVCGDQFCGDGIVTSPEECDNGAGNGAGLGCEITCKFSCVSTDSARNCTPTEPCDGKGTCDDNQHTCTAGTPLGQLAVCSQSPLMYCESGKCSTPMCSNTIVEPGEQCDDGNQQNGDGCDNCKFSCVNPQTDCLQTAPACEAWTCDANHVCLAAADAAQDGSTCGNGLVCKTGVCGKPPAVCGNGVLELGEQCDFGAGNGAGTGCEASCQYSCTAMPNSCDDGNACNGVETCGNVMVNGQVGHKCSPGAAPVDGMTCGGGKICLGGACKTSICGDSFVDPLTGEQCDNGGANGPGTGCELSCKFSCANFATDCTAAAPPCNAWTSCSANHTCVSSADNTQNGKTCGVNLMCKNGVCTSAQAVCGNGTVEAGEACDFGAGNGAGTGCESNCQFSCTTNPNSCDDKNPCNGIETCGAVMVGGKMGQKCAAGTPLPRGTSCGMSLVCNAAQMCASSVCGDGIVDASIGEQCDLGAGNGPGTGCESNCHFSCTITPDSCDDKNPCNGVEVCTAAMVGGQAVQKCAAGVPLGDGTTCGAGKICLTQTCKTSTCGDSYVDAGAGEQCDFGAGNGAGTGCEATCKYSCTTVPNSCDDMNACNGVETCVANMVNGSAGQKCMAGTAPAAGTTCGTGNICLMMTCKASVCGDGYVDAAKGEACHRPNGTTCDATCHAMAAAVCGNGKRETGEQCDDMNTTNLDGCSSSCKFELDHRIDYFKIQFATDAYCTPNALGGAIVGLAQGQFQTALDTGIANGSTSILFAMLGLNDVTGATNQASFNVGVLSGTAAMPAGNPKTYDGTNDLDWLYTATPNSVDANRTPLAQLAASVNGRVLNAGPGNVVVDVVLTAGVTPLSMTHTNVQVTLGAASVPTVSANNLPPGWIAAQNLDPAQTAVATAGQQNLNGSGKLCGNVSAKSLSTVLVPAAIVSLNCGYKATSSILDLLVNGCTFFVQLVIPTNPDQADPTAPAAGAGAPYKLSGNPVNACKDKNGAVVPLANCLAAAAYSSYFRFASDRVIINK